MKTYEPADDEVRDRVQSLLLKYYPELANMRARIDLIFAISDKIGEPAVKLHGYPCLATVRALGLKDRAMDRGDAEIVIDQGRYQQLTDEERDALLDHELHHLELARDGKRIPRVDALGRPLFTLRLHDRQFGWFDAIAARHGLHSSEVRQARYLYAEAEQIYFDFARDGKPEPKPNLQDRTAGFQKTAREHGAVISIHTAGSDNKVVIDKDGIRKERIHPKAASR